MKLYEIALTRNQLKLITALATHERPSDCFGKVKSMKGDVYIRSFNNDKQMHNEEIRKLLDETFEVLREVCATVPLESVMVNRNKFFQWVFYETTNTHSDILHHIDLDGILKDCVGKEIPASYIEGAFDGKLNGEMIEIESNFKLTDDEG